MSGAAPGPVDVRAATPADVREIHAMVCELAAYEREPDAVKASPADLERLLFGPEAIAEGLIAERVDPGAPTGRRVIGHALFYRTFSTWEGRPGHWLEDLYVRPEARGTGAGAALLRALAALTVERGYTRLEWVALDWNELALDFYSRFGAERLEEWGLLRLSGEPLAAAARPRN